MKAKNGYYVSGRFPQYKKTNFTSDSGLAAAKTNCLAIDKNGTLFAGTDSGLYELSGEKFIPVFDSVINTPVNSITVMECGKLAVCAGKKLYYVDSEAVCFIREFESDLVEVCDKRGKLWVLTEERFAGTDYTAQHDFVNRPLEGGKGLSTAVSDKEIYVATETNISVIHGKRMEWKNILPQFSDMPKTQANTICFDNAGYLWIGTDNGAAIHDNQHLWLTADKIHTLPKNAVYKIKTDAVGGRYYASDVGVIYQKAGKMKYFSAHRWVLNNKINDIAVTADGSKIFAATDEGISMISCYETTLIEKANEFEKNIKKYHYRHGFVAERIIENYDINSGHVHISDNDGSWTGLYVAAESFRYAVTGEQEALENARESLKAMLLLTKITGLPGFTARAVRYEGETGFGDGNHEWVKTPDGKAEWKCETSSDEMTCHFFAQSIYYDLCANEEEKAEIRTALLGIMEHILNNNYRLIDHDGLPTTWAAWNPNLLNHDDKWYFERGINSLELLGFLKVSYHISGDEKYKKLYDSFIKEHHYPLNVMQHKIRDAHICHIDDNLGFLAALTLLRLEEDESLRSIYLCGVEDHWEYERVEKQPMFCFVHALLTGRDEDLTEGVESLRQIPLDLIHYWAENSKRKDLIYDTEQEEWHEECQLKIPLPYDERNVHRPDASVFEIDTVDRRHSQEGTLFLLPYWTARYFGLLKEAEE
ncbi:MAG: hypothetical protein MJ147_05820 [Clostridia bacterium]|nr:hypothetical protein [Clostridia bacterium]